MNRVASALACGWLLVVAGCAFSPTPLPDEEVAVLLKKGSLVFDATLRSADAFPEFLRGKGGNLPNPAGSNRFFLAMVDKVHRDGATRVLQPGNEVWIVPLPSTDEGQVMRATWYTRSWISGKQLVVREVGHESTLRSTADIERLVHGPEGLEDNAFAQQLRQAQEVIVGVVQGIGPIRVRDSEHDPDWQVATIQVEQRLKGPTAIQTVSVQFALSRDIAWYRAPKLETDQRAVLILRRVSEAAPYFLIDPGSLRSVEELPRIQRLLKRDERGK